MLIDTAEDLGVLMPMYNLIECSKNNSKTLGSLWNYYRDELSDDTNDNNDPNEKVTESKSFKSRQALQEVLLIIMLMKILLMPKVMKLIILLMMQIKLYKRNWHKKN